MRRLFVLLALLLALVASGWSPTVAQDATPATAACDAPALPPGTPTPMEEMEGPPAAATPADEMAGMEMGTPEAVEVAEAAAEAAAMTPAATPAAPAGTPADRETADEVVAAVENVAACLAGGDYLGFAALLTENYRLNEFGMTNPYDAPMFFEGFPPFALRSADDVQTHDDGRVSADVITSLGGRLIERSRSYFVRQGDYLLLDQEVLLPIEGAAAEVEAAMIDYAFVLSQSTIPAGQMVAFTAPNEGQYPHELVVVRLPEGVTVEQVLQDPSLEEQIDFVGFTFAAPGQTAYFGLDGLDAGTYTLVCFVEEPEGVPHIERGMIAEFTVA